MENATKIEITIKLVSMGTGMKLSSFNSNKWIIRSLKVEKGATNLIRLLGSVLKMPSSSVNKIVWCWTGTSNVGKMALV